MFDYDVFLSFSAQDHELVKPIWQRLSSSGVRVFWSDETLKQAAGRSFVSVIQNALDASKDFVLVWTANAARSPWVEEEYQAFYSHAYIRDKATRRLIVLCPDQAFLSKLPPLLRHLQSVQHVDDLARVLGVVDIQQLLARNAELEMLTGTLRERIAVLERRIAVLQNGRQETAPMQPHHAVIEARPVAAPAVHPADTFGVVTLEDGTKYPITRLAGVDRKAVNLEQVNLRYSRSLEEYFGASYSRRDRMPLLNLRGLRRIDLIPYSLSEKADIKRIGKGCVDTDGCTTRKLSLTFDTGAVCAEIFADIGREPRYGVGPEDQMYDLADYDVIAVEINASDAT